MASTFFVDENDLALGKALGKLHGNVLFPGHPDLPAVPRQSLDDGPSSLRDGLTIGGINRCSSQPRRAHGTVPASGHR